MALVLSYSVTERNDNKLLTVTDTAGIYNAITNPTGWGAPNRETTDITAVGGAHDLQLIVSITTSDNVTVVYDAIDLFTVFVPGVGFADVGDLVFPLTCAMLVKTGVALGTASDEFPDGIYGIEYVYNHGEVSEITVDVDNLVEGRVRNSVYELLRTLPTTYNCSECKTKEISDIIFSYGLLNAMSAASYVAKKEELINQLYTLERIITNGSSYTW